MQALFGYGNWDKLGHSHSGTRPKKLSKKGDQPTKIAQLMDGEVEHAEKICRIMGSDGTSLSPCSILLQCWACPL